jgi:uncharacterized protein YndB with AHSA1/START domain
VTAYEPLLEASVEIDADPTQVWALVSDVTRMSEWSPQVTSTRLRVGFDDVALGAQFTNRNINGEMEWTTHAEVVEFRPGEQLAFRVAENRVVWSFTLEPTDGGTRLVQRRETPEGISDLSLELTDGFMGGQEAFTQVLRDGMRQTLDLIKRAAQAPS